MSLLERRNKALEVGQKWLAMDQDTFNRDLLEVKDPSRQLIRTLLSGTDQERMVKLNELVDNPNKCFDLMHYCDMAIDHNYFGIRHMYDDDGHGGIRVIRVMDKGSVTYPHEHFDHAPEHLLRQAFYYLRTLFDHIDMRKDDLAPLPEGLGFVKENDPAKYVKGRCVDLLKDFMHELMQFGATERASQALVSFRDQMNQVFITQMKPEVKEAYIVSDSRGQRVKLYNTSGGSKRRQKYTNAYKKFLKEQHEVRYHVQMHLPAPEVITVDRVSKTVTQRTSAARQDPQMMVDLAIIALKKANPDASVTNEEILDYLYEKVPAFFSPIERKNCTAHLLKEARGSLRASMKAEVTEEGRRSNLQNQIRVDAISELVELLDNNTFELPKWYEKRKDAPFGKMVERHLEHYLSGGRLIPSLLQEEGLRHGGRNMQAAVTWDADGTVISEQVNASAMSKGNTDQGLSSLQSVHERERTLGHDVELVSMTLVSPTFRRKNPVKSEDDLGIVEAQNGHRSGKNLWLFKSSGYIKKAREKGIPAQAGNMPVYHKSVNSSKSAYNDTQMIIDAFITKYQNDGDYKDIRNFLLCKVSGTQTEVDAHITECYRKALETLQVLRNRLDSLSVGTPEYKQALEKLQFLDAAVAYHTFTLNQAWKSGILWQRNKKPLLPTVVEQAAGGMKGVQYKHWRLYAAMQMGQHAAVMDLEDKNGNRIKSRRYIVQCKSGKDRTGMMVTMQTLAGSLFARHKTILPAGDVQPENDLKKFNAAVKDTGRLGEMPFMTRFGAGFGGGMILMQMDSKISRALRPFAIQTSKDARNNKATKLKLKYKHRMQLKQLRKATIGLAPDRLTDFVEIDRDLNERLARCQRTSKLFQKLAKDKKKYQKLILASEEQVQTWDTDKAGSIAFVTEISEVFEEAVNQPEIPLTLQEKTDKFYAIIKRCLPKMTEDAVKQLIHHIEQGVMPVYKYGKRNMPIDDMLAFYMSDGQTLRGKALKLCHQRLQYKVAQSKVMTAKVLIDYLERVSSFMSMSKRAKSRSKLSAMESYVMAQISASLDVMPVHEIRSFMQSVKADRIYSNPLLRSGLDRKVLTACSNAIQKQCSETTPSYPNVGEYGLLAPGVSSDVALQKINGVQMDTPFRDTQLLQEKVKREGNIHRHVDDRRLPARKAVYEDPTSFVVLQELRDQGSDLRGSFLGPNEYDDDLYYNDVDV